MSDYDIYEESISSGSPYELYKWEEFNLKQHILLQNFNQILNYYNNFN